MGNDYEFEPGNGGERNQYLRYRNIKTYLIKDNQPRTKVRLLVEPLSSLLVKSSASFEQIYELSVLNYIMIPFILAE